MPTRRHAALLPLPMVLLFAALATAPLWLASIGLYQYLALEIMISMLYALGYNLLLGYGGLPSFGHGAFFGVGAYAFGLLQQRLWPNLWLDLAGAVVAAALLGAVVARVHLASARDLLRAADHRLRPGRLVRVDQVAHGDRRRGRAARHPAPARGLRLRALRPRGQRGAVLLRVRDLRRGRARAVAARPLAVRPHPGGDPAERGPRARSSATTSGCTSGWRSRCRRRSPGSPARCSRWRSSRRIRT